ncbi:MAG: hypothetical protein ACNFW9_02130 [Candidatus Kerfeldbacteria bacterium]|jgi:hypothetical protein
MEFNVGDMVDEQGSKLIVYGRILSLTETEAQVKFRIPLREKNKGFCDACGSSDHLSINDDTDELVCLVTGCGHEYGFKETTETIALTKLINITAKRAAEKEAEKVN